MAGAAVLGACAEARVPDADRKSWLAAPPSLDQGKCDVKTLGIESGVGRAALYTTYLHLKEEFERRRDQLRAAGEVTDPREAQIVRLKEQIDKLKTRLTEQDREIAGHAAFRIHAVSQLAAQHDETGRLRSALADPAHVPNPPVQATHAPFSCSVHAGADA